MDQQLKHVILTLCEDVGTPRALAVKLLCMSEEWAQLQQLRVKPHDYNDSESFWKDSLVTELLRKCKLPSGVDTAAVARANFWACEAQCKRTNARLSRFVLEREHLVDPLDLRVAHFFDELRKEVRFVLGELPRHLIPRFSGGATYADIGSLTTIPDKMSSRPTVYPQSRDVVLPFWQETSWFRSLCEERPWYTDPDTVRGNIFFTVPKDGKTDRGCCKEASLPVSFQLDAGRLMRARLKKVGIDIKTGKARHQELARLGSLHGHLTTDDQTNASDTIARFFVEAALGDVPDWFLLLDSLRAHETRITDGGTTRWVKLEKFSSMGNGFTFELETLLFACLARVIVRSEGGDPDQVACYGDDLIYPSVHSESVRAALKFVGMTVNLSKSFSDGPFRESCGGDFFDGVPVRAHYLKETPSEPQHWISLANGFRRVARNDSDNDHRWSVVRRCWLSVLAAIPGNIRRLRGPVELGDVVIHDHPDFWQVRDLKPTSGWDTREVKGYTPIPTIISWDHWTPMTQLGSRVIMSDCSRGVTPRDGVSGYRTRWISLPGSRWLPN